MVGIAGRYRIRAADSAVEGDSRLRVRSHNYRVAESAVGCHKPADSPREERHTVGTVEALPAEYSAAEVEEVQVIAAVVEEVRETARALPAVVAEIPCSTHWPRPYLFPVPFPGVRHPVFAYRRSFLCSPQRYSFKASV